MRIAALAVLAGLLAGCGDAKKEPSAEDEIRAIIAERKADPSSICDHMTGALLESIGGAESCRQLAAAGDNADANAEVERIDLDGDTAIVHFKGGQEEDAKVTFRRVGGEWKLDVSG